MSSTNAEAHGLPATAPPFTKPPRPLGDPAKFLVFHTALLFPADLEELLAQINCGAPSSRSSKLAPAPDFSNRSLRDVYDCFVALREQDETVYPFYFIVADRVEYAERGVLGVCLDCSQGGGEEGAEVGVARCAVDMADSWGADFYHGMADWEEMRDAEAVEWGDEGDEAGDPGPVDPVQRHADEATRYGWNPPVYAVQERDIYGWYSLVEKAVPINQMLDPLWLDKTPDQCRFQMLGNYHASEDPWDDICMNHPGQASNRPRVNRSIVLVAEKEDADQEDGVAIVRLQSNRPPKILARVSAGEAIAKADEIS